MRRADPLRELCTNALRRAEIKGFDHNITPEYLNTLLRVQNGLCYFFKVQLHIDGTSADSPYQVSLDRLDNNRGYVIGNVALTCIAANLSRNKFPAEEFSRFCDNLPAHLLTRKNHALECLMRKLSNPRPILVTGDLDVVTRIRMQYHAKSPVRVGKILYGIGFASFVMHLDPKDADAFYASLKAENCIRAMALDTQGVIHG